MFTPVDVELVCLHCLTHLVDREDIKAYRPFLVLGRKDVITELMRHIDQESSVFTRIIRSDAERLKNSYFRIRIEFLEPCCSSKTTISGPHNNVVVLVKDFVLVVELVVFIG